MKKIKVFIIALLVIASFTVMPSMIKASEITTEPEITTEITTEAETTEITTEAITTEEVVVEDSLSIDDAFEKAKVYIVGVVLSLFSGGMLSLVASIILNQLRKKAIEKLEEAVNSNLMSQETANKAIATLDNGIDKINEKVVSLEQNVLVKVQNLDTHLVELINKIDTEFVQTLKVALTDYFTEESE